MTDFIEPTSNPMAPEAAFRTPDEPQHQQKLSNSDFRKLLMTPKATAPPPSTGGSTSDSAVKTNQPESNRRMTDHSTEVKDRDHGSRQKHHKRHQGRHQRRDHAKERPMETPQRYRDRAKERREGKLVTVADDGEEREYENDDETLSRTADYRAVAPSTAAGASLAERRRMIIQESKYLGGDMEHTHLVKGLDYVLLQKVRLEIQNKELEAEQVLDTELSKPEVVKEQPEEGLHFRTKLAANVVDLLFNDHPTERNEYFQPGRMAYRIELEDDSVDFEVPATVIRSKSDILQIDGRGQAAITTNEIVINKLTQILSYLRAGKRHAKKAKMKGHFGENRDELLPGLEAAQQYHGKKAPAAVGGNIFDDIGSDYVPSRRNRAAGATDSIDHLKEKSSAEAEPSSRNKTSYFVDAPNETEGLNAPSVATTGPGGSLNAAKEFMQELNQRFGPKADDKIQDKASLERFFAKTKVTCYDECYPGFAESYDAMGDSDDEADFSKMDLGSKKGPVGRWDFETQEEYSAYMSNKEALPKAAFQYGVKMVDGRRTRRLGPKDEKAELDRQLQKIQSIIHKRKQLAEDAAHPAIKNPRY